MYFSIRLKPQNKQSNPFKLLDKIPEENSMVERYFRSLKEECVWLQRFISGDAAFAAISDQIDFYNQQRVHSALRYVAPRQVRRQL